MSEFDEPEEFLGSDQIMPADTFRTPHIKPRVPLAPAAVTLENETRLTELRSQLNRANLEVKTTRKNLAAALATWTSHGRTRESVARDAIAETQAARRAKLSPPVIVPGPSHYDRIRARPQAHAGEFPIDRGYSHRRGTSTVQQPKLPSQR